MTMRTRDRILCECGHQGYLCCAEKDQPFSSLWESYSFEGFQGRDAVITSNAERPESLLAAMQPTCPQCGQTGKVRYATRS